MKRVLLTLLTMCGCTCPANVVIEDMDNNPGRCIFRYPNGPMHTYEDVVKADLSPFNPEAITLTFKDGSSAVINGFGSVHCFPYKHEPELG